MNIRIMAGLFVASTFLFAGVAFINFRPYRTPSESLTQPTVIIVAFGHRDQTGNWDGEAAPYGKLLQNLQDISSQLPFCQNVYQGTLYQQPVLLAITGMAKIRTSACTGDLLHYTQGNIREVILSGIGGISAPIPGGLQTKVGDICINSLTVDFDRQYYSADLAYSSELKPGFWSASSTDGIRFGNGSRQLAADIYQAGMLAKWPNFPQILINNNNLYGVTGNQTQIWGPDSCLEVSGDLFWHDKGVDKRAREIASAWLSKNRSQPVSADQTVIITSMEAASVGTVVQLWNTNYGASIPFAYVRSASNFDRPSLSPAGLPAADGRSSLESGMQSDNTAFPIQIQALPVLKLLESRNK